MYKGLGGGKFASFVELEQEILKEKDYNKYLFTNPMFYDYNGDGLLDAVMGGKKGIRVSLNIGTKEMPAFGERTWLHTVTGEPVVAYDSYKEGETVVDYKCFAYMVDWDNDGVADLITSSGYCYYKASPILFHKGVMKDGVLMFEQSQKLIKEWGYEKVLPGKTLHLNITDYNHDGVKDIVIGTTMTYNTVSKDFVMDKVYNFDSDRASTAFHTELEATRGKYQGEEFHDKFTELLAKYRPVLNASRSDKNNKSRGTIVLLEGVKN